MGDERRVVHLDQLYEFASGLSKPRSDFGAGYPFLSFKDVFYNFFVPSNLSELVRSSESERRSLSVKRGDVFLTRTSETVDELGMSCVALTDIPDATFNGFTKRLRPKSQGVVVPEFAGYFFRSSSFRSAVYALSSLSTRASLNNEMLARLSIALPPVDEQQAIGQVLKSLDDKIELNRRMNETLEAMARALFKSWFVDFDPVRAKVEGREPFYPHELWSLFSSALDQDDKPEGWSLGSLIDLCELKRGYDLPTAQRLPGSYPIVSSSGISGAHSVPMAQAPGVVTGRYGTIGDVYFINEAYWPLNTALYVRDFKGNCPRFVYYALLQVEFLQYSDKAAVPGINRNHLHQAPIVLPPRPLQKAFEALLAPVWARQESNKAEVTTLTTLRDTLLPKLISGELRVKAAEKMIEAVA